MSQNSEKLANEKKETYNEKCPWCGSENYDTDNYEEIYGLDSVQFAWDCECLDCKKQFYLNKTYKLTQIETIKREDNIYA